MSLPFEIEIEHEEVSLHIDGLPFALLDEVIFTVADDGNDGWHVTQADIRCWDDRGSFLTVNAKSTGDMKRLLWTALLNEAHGKTSLNDWLDSEYWQRVREDAPALVAAE